ncbi:hypothetical protein ACN47E_006615 [Coniothyrium glycines]
MFPRKTVAPKSKAAATPTTPRRSSRIAEKIQESAKKKAAADKVEKKTTPAKKAPAKKSLAKKASAEKPTKKKPELVEDDYEEIEEHAPKKTVAKSKKSASPSKSAMKRKTRNDDDDEDNIDLAEEETPLKKKVKFAPEANTKKPAVDRPAAKEKNSPSKAKKAKVPVPQPTFEVEEEQIPEDFDISSSPKSFSEEKASLTPTDKKKTSPTKKSPPIKSPQQSVWCPINALTAERPVVIKTEELEEEEEIEEEMDEDVRQLLAESRAVLDATRVRFADDSETSDDASEALDVYTSSRFFTGEEAAFDESLYDDYLDNTSPQPDEHPIKEEVTEEDPVSFVKEEPIDTPAEHCLRCRCPLADAEDWMCRYDGEHDFYDPDR